MPKQPAIKALLNLALGLWRVLFFYPPVDDELFDGLRYSHVCTLAYSVQLRKEGDRNGFGRLCVYVPSRFVVLRSPEDIHKKMSDRNRCGAFALLPRLAFS